jgi:hypothetical protein
MALAAENGSGSALVGGVLRPAMEPLSPCTHPPSLGAQQPAPACGVGRDHDMLCAPEPFDLPVPMSGRDRMLPMSAFARAPYVGLRC